METIVIVNPAIENVAGTSKLAQRLPALAGMRIGLIDNAKHHADDFLAEVERLMLARSVAGFVRYRKDNASLRMPDDAITNMAQRCDAVVHAVAD